MMKTIKEIKEEVNSIKEGLKESQFIGSKKEFYFIKYILLLQEKLKIAEEALEEGVEHEKQYGCRTITMDIAQEALAKIRENK